MAVTITRLLHFLGLIMVFAGLGGALVNAINGGGRDHPARKLVAMMHGLGLVLMLVAGIGLTHSMGYGSQWPGFVWAKLVIWLGLGGAIVPILRKPELGKTLWWVVLGLGALATYLAVAKPF